MTLLRVLNLVAVYSVWVALAFGVVQWLRGGKLLVKLIVVYLAFIVLVEEVARYYAYRGINNMWLSHVYIPIEYALFCLMYYFAFTNRNLKRALLASIVLFISFSVVDSLYIEGLKHMNTYARTLGSGLVITLSLLYFHKVFNDLELIYLEKDPMFLLSAGLIIYYAGISTNYVLFNLMVAYDIQITRNFSVIVYFFNTFLSGLLTLVLWRAPRQ